MNIQQESFGVMADGRKVDKITITNENGYNMSTINYGATLISFKMPDKYGKMDEITLGFDTLKQYIKKRIFFGATIGRYGNRIAKGKFTLDDKNYTLACNNKPNHLHGGRMGLDRVYWEPQIYQNEDSASVSWKYKSPDGEEGYPGNVFIMCIYTLNNNNELIIEYFAESDALTPLNLTNHTYWNLAGAGSGSIMDHHFKLSCPSFLPVDKTQIPTGEILPVDHTPFDFRESKSLGQDFQKTENGYDHCLVLPTPTGKEPFQFFADISEPQTGRTMAVGTTQPGAQLYTGNNMPKTLKGAEGRIYHRYGAFCLETQNFPDAVNQPGFPDPFLKPGETYQHKTVHRFGIKS